jgi:hypothetical protein
LLIILWIARGKAWNYAKNCREDEDEDEALGQPHSSGVLRLSFGSRPPRVAGELGVDDDAHPDTSHNASWSTVVGGGGAEHRDGDGDVNVIELGLCGSEPSSVIDDLKA